MAVGVDDLLLLFAPSIISALFGGGKEEQKQTGTSTTTQTTPWSGWMDPAKGITSQFLLNAMIKNLGRYQGAGMPGGQGLGMGNMFGDLLGLLGKEWPQLLAGYEGKAGTTTAQGPCITQCKAQYPDAKGADYQTCLVQCRQAGKESSSQGPTGPGGNAKEQRGG